MCNYSGTDSSILFATAMGATSLISKVIISFPVDIAIISSNTVFNCSGVFGI